MTNRNKVKPIRSYTAGVSPDLTEIETHELAISWADQKIFTKNPSGNLVTVSLGGSGGGGGGGSSVTEIAEFATTAQFPATGSAGVVYIATDSSRLYRWDSSAVYIEIGPE